MVGGRPRRLGAPGSEAPLRFDVPVGPQLRLTGRGPALFAEDQRVLQGVRGRGRDRVEGRRLGEQAREARDARRPSTASARRCSPRSATTCARRWPGSRRRSAACARPTSTGPRRSARAAGHDRGLRRPARRGGRQPARREPAAGGGADRAGRGRWRSTRSSAPRCSASPARPSRVEIDVAEDLPLVQADAGLLERVLVNLIDNALRHGGGGAAGADHRHGRRREREARGRRPRPRRAEAERERCSTPFQRLDDRGGRPASGSGSRVARGFTEAMGGALAADHSAGRRADDARSGSPLAARPPEDAHDPRAGRRGRARAAPGARHQPARPRLRGRHRRRRRAPRSPPPPRQPPDASCSTSACPTWTAPR